MLLSDSKVNRFLNFYKNLKLSLTFENFYISLIPNELNFLITVEYSGELISKDFYNTWEEAYKNYKILCNHYIDQCPIKLEEKSSNTKSNI